MTAENKVSRIVIIEKEPHAGRHEIEFSDPKKARNAYSKMIAFWEHSGHDAILVQGENKSVSVSADVVASVTLIINEKKVAQKKSGK